MQINASLKELLKEKFEQVEKLKTALLKLIEEEERFMQEPLSITGTRRFTSEVGISRINFSDLVEYFENQFDYVRSKGMEIDTALRVESGELEERKANFEFLKDRTERAEVDAERVGELTHQRNRLKETFREQSATIRALQDRVEMLEMQRLPCSTTVSGSRVEHFIRRTPDTLLDEEEFIGDVLVKKLFPCII